MRPALISAIFLLAVSLAGAASDPAACREDARRLCADVRPGGGRVVACLQGRADELSSGCRKALIAGENEVWDAVAACQQELRSYCAGVPTGEGRVLACLRSNQSRLSDACRKRVRRLPG